MATGKHTLWLIALLFIITGCTVPSKNIKTVGPSEVKLSDKYLQQGKSQEEKNEPVLAYQSYTLALTVEPANREAEEGQKRMETVLYKLAEDHYQRGLKLSQKGQYGKSRQHFLAALSYWPSYPKAIKLLTTRKRIQIMRYVEHTIKAGESLSKIAEIYYGDQSKFPVIAQYNNLSDATRLFVGQTIKIPETQGTTLRTDQEPIQTITPDAMDYTLPPLDDEWQQLIDTALENEKALETNQIAAYREQGVVLFNEDQYREAIDEFTKALSLDPNDKDSLDYIYKSHYQMALSLYENEDYLAAREEFKASLRYNSDCLPCIEYIEKSENLYKEMHYKKGMEHYGRERLEEAIQEWEKVIALDPNYKNVGYLINKARVILIKIEEIKKNQKESNGKADGNE
jgi:tetratricopeptide (TPR) repeat protein